MMEPEVVGLLELEVAMMVGFEVVMKVEQGKEKVKMNENGKDK